MGTSQSRARKDLWATQWLKGLTSGCKAKRFEGELEEDWFVKGTEMTKPASNGISCARLSKSSLSWVATCLSALLCACSSNSDSPPSASALREFSAVTLGLSGDPATPRGARQVIPDSDPLVKLGQLLFFSQTIGAGYDVSCGTCHHPDFGGSDGLSLPVGAIPENPATVGPGRKIDPDRDLDPSADGGPNMHRNSITTFNAALFDRNLMFDGRVFVLDAEIASGGHGQRIRTPESGQAPDLNPLDGLLEFTMKGPIVNDNEMRGFFYTDISTPAEYREHIVLRLRGTVDNQYNPVPGAAANWLALFRAAFATPDAHEDEIITIFNVQRALAAYIKSQIFVDTPWRSFLQGDDAAISRKARKGAILFLAAPSEGGLGCNSCHRGDRFTDENFHNVAFPQFGRGFGRAQRTDVGRWFETRMDADMQAFRTPSLLNVAKTAPYGHTGAFATLEQLLAYHANPRQAVDGYDFTLSHLDQFRNGEVRYAYAEQRTREAIARENFTAAEQLLPNRDLTKTEIDQLVAFLNALTDRCVANPDCIGQWAPRMSDDPDGHTLIRNRAFGTPAVVDGAISTYEQSAVPLEFAALEPRATFADVLNCPNSISSAPNTGENSFVQRTGEDFGLVDRHGYKYSTWFRAQQSALEVAMMAGGVTAGYLDDDCWPDLAFTGGSLSGMAFYRNLAGKRFSRFELLSDAPGKEHSGAALADLNGDYRRELVLGNVLAGSVPVYGSNGTGQYEKIADLPMVRPTFGISFAPLDASGYPYMYLAHWSGGTGTNGSSPALWRSDGEKMYPWDVPGGTTSASVDQRFNFTPKFADFTGDGRIDLVIASDFLTSSALRNVPDGTTGGWKFVNETIESPLTDQNGMGSTLLDIDNDGNLEWFVTSILDHTGVAAGNWGVTGNRLYRNASTAQRIAFTDITDRSGVRDGYWGWGSCAADFNNDGFVDLFHVNGFGHIPDDVAINGPARALQQHYRETALGFIGKPPRLFINNGDGTLSDRAAEWGIAVPSEGRGVVCLDHDRDGDTDIVVFDHSNRLQFFENRSGNRAGRRFIGIRLVGTAPNTDAIGARIFLTADVGQGHGVQTQMRVVETNSNFNSQNLPDVSFGLGEATEATLVRVVWPNGSEFTCEGVDVNQFLVLDQRAPACPGRSQ